MLAFASSITIRLRLLYLLPCFIILINVDLSTAQAPADFLSIDCGSSQTTNYTDTLGIEWAPDEAIWPEISGWSLTSTVTPPAGDTTGGAKYQTLRYFPPTKASTLIKQSKFCYTLPAIANAYYLIRATFWYGKSATTTLYNTRVPGSISFRVMVDTYAGAWINITLPQSAPLTEEMYIRTLIWSSSVSVCFSAASEDSDAPFVSALELRPLPSKMTSVAMINDTNTALRTAARDDFGASPDAPPIIRYPDDTLDRLWRTWSSPENANQTSEVVDVGIMDMPPVRVMQTSLVGTSTSGFSHNVTLTPAGKPQMYYVVLFFAELDPRVNAPGLRIFDIKINNRNLIQGVDVYNATNGLYVTLELYTTKALGKYSDYLLLKATSTPTSVFPPFIAAAEILQLFDNPIVPESSSVDIAGIRGITSTFSNQLGRFTGDPCLPVGYKYPWINCTGAGILPTRVISISLSNSSLVGNIPPSINDLDQLVQISFDGNALEGPLPVDLNNLVNLQVLILSNNKLTGSIPESLGNLPKLTYLDLRNNNFSGVIPLSIQQNSRLTVKYDGNPLLCLSNSQTTCTQTPPPSPSPSPSPSNLPLIIGLVVGVALVLCIALVTCLVCKKRKRNPTPGAKNEAGHEGQNEEKPSLHQTNRPYTVPAASVDVALHDLSHTRVVEAANVSSVFTFQEIVAATRNFTRILGRGGFGIVYKGTLNNGTIVAVKVLSDASQQGTEQFVTEVTILSRVHHKNLVGLLGYCIEEKLILVYEYMSNGSLYDCLFKKSSLGATPLSWTQRLKILLDAARGLAYLHGSCNPQILHMDVKSSNILLSETLEGKMSDFGISRQTSNDGDVQVTTKLVATPGYVDPWFADTLMLSEKVDIYSFGIVLLEVMCGQPPFIRDFENPNNAAIHIVDWARYYYQRNDLESIVFQEIGDYKVSSIWKVAEIAMKCVEKDGWKRPTMDEVCNELSEVLRSEASYRTTYASTIAYGSIDGEDQLSFGSTVLQPR